MLMIDLSFLLSIHAAAPTSSASVATRWVV